MAKIFISYSSRHRDLTQELAGKLEAHFGRDTVWWDQAGLRAGDKFSPEITRALDDAVAVVVVWTAGAVASDWVYAEAVRAAEQSKIVTVQAHDLDRKTIPLPFNVYHTPFLTDTAAMIAAIERLISGDKSPLPRSVPGSGFRAFLLDPKQEKLPLWAIGKAGPASLLLAKYRLVPYEDFHGLRDEFVRWAIQEPADGTGAPVLGRLVHAPAGLGKTRALIEIADELTKQHGWLAGFVPRDVRTDRESLEALGGLILGGREAAGLMLIVDYAESRQDDVVWLADQLVRRAEGVAKPARLVLISRGSGVWWRELLLKTQSLQFLCGVGGDAYDEVEIPEEIKTNDRRLLFDAAIAAFLPYRRAMGLAAATLQPPSADLVRTLETETDYDRPLAVQIAALLHVAGVDTAEDRRGMAGLIDRILGLEYEHWDKTLRIAGKPNWQAAIRNGVAQATLVAHVDNAQAAETLLAGDPIYHSTRDIDIPRVCHDLSLLFPGESDGLAGLEPDLIGEQHVASVATDTLIDACLDWAGEDREQRQHILTVLNRATRPEHGANASRCVAQLERLARTKAAALGGDLVKVALETPGQLLNLCPALESQTETLDESALASIDAELPLQSLALMSLSLSVAQRRADVARQLDAGASEAADVTPDLREQILSHLAARIGTLGTRLSNLGRREEALAATQEAVDIRRRLAQTRPDAFLQDLASSLNNCGAMFSDLGRREEALAATQEAVDIRRRLAQTRPDAFLPDLATSISVMSDALAALDRHEGAAQAAIRALEILVPFVERYPQTYERLARTIATDVSRYCKAAGLTPDPALLARVEKALGNNEVDENDPAIAALKAKIYSILEAAKKSRTLDEAALAELLKEVADQVRTFWANRSS